MFWIFLLALIGLGHLLLGILGCMETKPPKLYLVSIETKRENIRRQVRQHLSTKDSTEQFHQ